MQEKTRRRKKRMITLGICDDEPKMRKTLKATLETKLQLLGEQYQILEYDSGETLLAGCRTDGLDILFLDIEMNGVNGMETARALRRMEADTILIFVTAYPDYVFQGYEVHAFHYILKPYKEQKILEVLEQALSQIKNMEEQFYTVEQKSGILRVPLKSIIAFCSDRRKISILTEDEKLEFYGKLNDVEAGLPDYFIRIHNRYLANLNYITALDPDGCICKGRLLPVSRTYRRQLEIAFARALLN